MRWFFLSPAPDPSSPSRADRTRGRRARRRRAWLGLPFLALLPFVVHATSVTPPSFSDLVSEAQMIARATVTSVDSRWVDAPPGHVIKTFVTFAIEKTLKGEPRDTVTLEFLGGTVGADTLRVAGMPRFTVGQHEIVFVQGNGVQFCPLVRFGHGRYHVRTDKKTQRRFVTRNDEAPLRSPDDVEQPEDNHRRMAAAPADADAMTPDDFEADITREVHRHAVQP